MSLRTQYLTGLVALAAGFGATLAAATLPPEVKFDDRGVFTIDSCVDAAILHFDPGWTGHSQRQLVVASGQPRTSASAHHVEGSFPTGVAGTFFQLIQDIKATGPGRFSYEASLAAAQPVAGKSLTLALSVPVKGYDITLSADGQPVVMPEAQVKKTVFDRDVESIELLLPTCKVRITGRFHLFVQGRFTRGDYYAVRLSPRKRSETVKDWSLKLDFTVTPLPKTMQHVDLKPVVNMGFRDDRAGDGRGGWTDQGPDNDLRMLKPGRLEFSGIDFTVIDPDRNQGRSCLVLSGNQGKYPARSEVKTGLPAAPCRYLYLLHACAWPPATREPIGKITAVGRNGSRRTFTLMNWNDCGNWWTPFDQPNAIVAWSAKNVSSPVGLYISRFNLGEIPERLIFESGATNVWMIVGATFADLQLPPAKRLDRATVIEANDRWLPLEFTGRTVPGSALDFSSHLDAPAGKYGRVVISPEGHFVFADAPDKRIRFFGPNLVGSANYLNREEADDFVRKAVSLGYNTIRFHHFEYGLLQRGAKDSLTFDPAALDRLDYLFAELKKHGLYITIDLYASRLLRPGDGIEECSEFKRYEMKALAPISPSALRNWKEFARRLLTRKNPYTGLSLTEDPALYSLNLINENCLVGSWLDCPATMPIYEKKFSEYLKARRLPENTPHRDGYFIAFLNDLQSRCIDEQIRFLRQDIGLKTLITDLNHKSLYSLAALRDKLDFVDNHQYWDHPRFAGKRWSYPYIFTAASATADNAAVPRGLMPSRIFGKPFTVTEFNYCNPNPWRMEGAPLMGGYAALQDWDGLYRFAWSHGSGAMKKLDAPNHFDLVNNPQAQLMERIIHMLFVRGDVKAARPAFAFTFTPEQVLELKGRPSSTGEYPREFTNLGLYARIGSLAAAKTFPGVQKLDPLAADWTAKLPAAARNALAQLGKTGEITSVTGEITLNNLAPWVRVVTPGSEVVSFRGNADGAVMRLRNADRFQTVALMALDRPDLRTARRLLLIQMPNLAASGQKAVFGHRLLLESWGKLPILLEKTRVQVALRLPAAMKVERLKLDGSPNGEVKAVFRNGELSFTADTGAKKGGVMAYLLTR